MDRGSLEVSGQEEDRGKASDSSCAGRGTEEAEAHKQDVEDESEKRGPCGQSAHRQSYRWCRGKYAESRE